MKHISEEWEETLKVQKIEKFTPEQLKILRKGFLIGYVSMMEISLKIVEMPDAVRIGTLQHHIIDVEQWIKEV